MSDEPTFGTPKLSVLHVPDHSYEQGPEGNKQRVQLPGKVQIGVTVDGAFVPLTEIGTVRLQKKIDAAKQAKDSES